MALVSWGYTSRNNMGYALRLDEIQQEVEQALANTTKVRPTPGPVATELVVPPIIEPRQKNWQITNGKVRRQEYRFEMDNDGDQFWITSREPLPANFQLTISAGLEYRNHLLNQNMLGDMAKVFCVRFDTDLVDDNILLAKGTHIQLSADRVVLSVAVNNELLIRHEEQHILNKPTHFSIGGYLARLILDNVTVIDLDEHGQAMGYDLADSSTLESTP